MPTTIGDNENENNATTESNTNCIFGPKICGSTASTFNDFDSINGSTTMIPILIHKNSGSLDVTSSSSLFTLLMCILYFRIVYW